MRKSRKTKPVDKQKSQLVATRLEPNIDSQMQKLVDKEGMTRSLWLRCLIMESVKGTPHEKD